MPVITSRFVALTAIGATVAARPAPGQLIVGSDLEAAFDSDFAAHSAGAGRGVMVAPGAVSSADVREQ